MSVLGDLFRATVILPLFSLSVKSNKAAPGFICILLTQSKSTESVTVMGSHTPGFAALGREVQILDRVSDLQDDNEANQDLKGNKRNKCMNVQ